MAASAAVVLAAMVAWTLVVCLRQSTQPWLPTSLNKSTRVSGSRVCLAAFMAAQH